MILTKRLAEYVIFTLIFNYSYASFYRKSQNPSFLEDVTNNIVDPGIAYCHKGNAPINTSSSVLLVYDYYPDSSDTYFTLNYPLYNIILASQFEKKQWRERKNNSILTIRNTYKSTPSTGQILHHVVINTEWLSFMSSIVSNVSTEVAGTVRSTGDASPCQTQCYDHESGGYTYHVCSYVYTKKGQKCGFTNKAKDDLNKAFEDAFKTNAQSDCTGRCMMAFNGGSSEMWLKIVRKDSGITMSDVICSTRGSRVASHDEL